jgi:hypothetical protein
MRVDPDLVMSQLDADRRSGKLREMLRRDNTCLIGIAPDEYPGKFMRETCATGVLEIGDCADGEFIAEFTLNFTGSSNFHNLFRYGVDN